MTRSAAQKEHSRARSEALNARLNSKRRTAPPAERQTLEQWLAQGHQVTVCEAISREPEAVIERVRKVRAELKFPKNPRNQPRAGANMRRSR